MVMERFEDIAHLTRPHFVLVEECLQDEFLTHVTDGSGVTLCGKDTAKMRVVSKQWCGGCPPCAERRCFVDEEPPWPDWTASDVVAALKEKG